MRGLLGDVVTPGAVLIIPISVEGLSEDWVHGLLDTTCDSSAQKPDGTMACDLRGFDVPSAQVEFDSGNEALGWVFDVGHRQKHFWMRHKAASSISLRNPTRRWRSHFVILSSMDLGSKKKVGRVTLLRSAPGRNWEMMCERTEPWSASSMAL